MNKPHVDWFEILLKCQSRFPDNSKAAWFCREQQYSFQGRLIADRVMRQRASKNGHGNPFPKNRFKKNESVEWLVGQPDLYCDDPLYDGNYVF